MRDLQLAVRGTPEALRERPLSVFSCCPTAPLKWSYETSQNVIDCARAGIPVEFVSMPLSGFVAPVTLAGSVVQHAAETLSGVVLSQLAGGGGARRLGGSPAIFDIRYETTPMGAIETMMLDCANAEVGRRLSLPTQGYIALSDAKALDAQAGLETGMGRCWPGSPGSTACPAPACSTSRAARAWRSSSSTTRSRHGGPPPARHRAARRLPLRPLFEELLREGHLLIAAHTRKHRREQIRFGSPVIERAPLGRWREEGETTLGQRASREVERLVAAWAPSRVPDEAKRALRERMGHAARAAGMGSCRWWTLEGDRPLREGRGDARGGRGPPRQTFPRRTPSPRGSAACSTRR